MDHSINQYADQVLNAVYAGLKGPANFPISKEQIKDELAQLRNRMAVKKQDAGITIDPEPFRQTIPKLKVERKDFSGVEGHTTNRQEFWAKIPELAYFSGIKPVAWVSAMDRAMTFKIVYGNDFAYARHDRFSGKLPTIWIQDTNLWLFNPPIANIQFITVRAIFENPRALNGIGGIKFTDMDPYPMPLSMGAEIRDKMIFDYINQYRRGTMQPTLMAGDLNISTGEK